ncbi:DUF393 domain-containing protein [Marinobacteraceae bacterium S3BR75-40.1]
MTRHLSPLIVYYDGACPTCVRDRRWYEKLQGRDDLHAVEWVDITGRDEQLRAEGIDPHDAMTELHVKDAEGRIHRELDAYILLMRRVRWLKPLALLINLPLIRPLLARWYHWWVHRRLRREGRL